MVNLENPENQNSEIAANTSEAGTWVKLLISICIFKHFDKWNKVCLLLLIAFSSLSDINTTLNIGITITLRYVIATTSLWCRKDITSISILNRSKWLCKSNKKPMSPQYRVSIGMLPFFCIFLYVTATLRTFPWSIEWAFSFTRNEMLLVNCLIQHFFQYNFLVAVFRWYPCKMSVK